MPDLHRRSFFIGRERFSRYTAAANVRWSVQRLMRTGCRLREVGRRSLLSAFWYLSRPSVQCRSLSALDQTETFDVCIVGSGPAGAVLGLDLVKRGFKTVILESGSRFNCCIPDTSVEQLDVCRSSGSIDYPVGASRYRGLGGTSNLWKGACPRLHPLDFQRLLSDAQFGKREEGVIRRLMH
jgi:hypothetical protein